MEVYNSKMSDLRSKDPFTISSACTVATPEVFKEAQIAIYSFRKIYPTTPTYVIIPSGTLEVWPVKDDDLVMNCGDVFFGDPRDAENILRRLKGRKQLLIGNHDKLTPNSILWKYFDKII